MTSLEWTVAENAAWCDLVCGGRLGPRAWTSPSRSPRYYPDAVTLTPDATSAWPGAVAAVAAAFPGRPVVGYEHGDDLRIALDHGAQPLGPLRVWVR